MNHIETFDSFDDMMAKMAQAEDEANSHLHPTQIELRDDVDNTRYWVRPFPEGQCLIFGEAWSFKQYCEVSASFVPDVPSSDEDDWRQYYQDLDEAVYEIRTFVESRKRGYLRGDAYSILEPRGEGGSTHVANVAPISKEAFEEAKAAGWQATYVSPLDLDLMGEEAARKGGWTPTLIKELEEIQRLMDEAAAEWLAARGDHDD